MASAEAAPRRSPKTKTQLETFELPALELPEGISSTQRSGKVRVCVVHTAWNSHYVTPVLEACLQTFKRLDTEYELVSVPGVNEIVPGVRGSLKRCPSAVICLGFLIRGESDGYKAACANLLQGLMKVNAQQDIPVISGVQMCQDEEQAEQRSHGSGNPGAALAESTIYMAQVTGKIAS
eukprot:TRINITY_DN29061_c0_g1_i1.p1 TRINITY_DN29061_c0_g1~~TRINITY_DN29061_c0_g1_i1.p1  ORF type:complete len:192 (+),score=37.01 TRINITY_DN29061_c0_g1_i1:41-577(+)